MEDYLDQKETEIIELSFNEMISIDGGIKKWMVGAAFLFGFGPGLFAMGYYNATH